MDCDDLSSDEEAVVSKVRDLMSALDRAKQYRARVTSIVDFVIVLLYAAVAGFALDLAITYLFYAYGIGSGTSLVPTLVVLIAIMAGMIGGAIAADRKVREVRVGQWEEDLREGFPGALKILTSLDWRVAVDDARIARLGSVLYGFLKIACYTFVFSVLLDVGIAISRVFLFWGSGPIPSLAIDAFGFALAFAFIVVAAASAGDMERRFHESSTLDSLVWELRWFYTDFARSEFKA